jgi:alkylation response protein AidB-like acyl-CoA dehydrogenase
VFPFTLNDEQRRYARELRSFVAREVTPVAEHHDRERSMPLELFAKFCDARLAEPFFRDDVAKTHPYLVSFCLAGEELGYGCPAIAGLITLSLFLNRLVLTLVDEPLRAELWPCLANKPVVTSFAASERLPGSDLLSLETRAERKGSGYVLSGRKEYSSNLRHASRVIVVARTSKGRSADAMSWFVVPTDGRGVKIGERWSTLGLRAMDLSPLELEDVEVPESHRIGAEGRGLRLMSDSLSQSRTTIAAIAVGVARRARDEIMAFAGKRQLYGDKLHKLQDYRFRIADMEVDIAAARALVYLSALKFDLGEDHTKEASIAKLFAGQMVMRVTEAASLMLGSVGYTGQSIVEKLFRDARHTAIIEGTEPTHKEIIFASLLRRGGY